MTAYGMALCVGLLAWLTTIGADPAPLKTAKEKGNDTPAQPDIPLVIPKVADGELTGSGMQPFWETIPWQSMTKLDGGGPDYTSRFKMAYSNTGIYVLFEGQDSLVSTTYTEDFGELWKGDVFEVFFHPDQAEHLSNNNKGGKTTSYVEYEINALGKELVLFLNRRDGKVQSRYPSRYEGARRISKAVHMQKSSGSGTATIEKWSAEIYFPFILLTDAIHTVPTSGTVWHANFCRIDHDSGHPVKWSWSPGITRSFHELAAFLEITFE